jgi:hypothetical protein
VLVPSWDGYADLWRPFFHEWDRHWPDCPFSVYLGANELSFSHPRVQMLRVPGGSSWSNEVRAQLNLLDHTYVLLVLEDFFWRAATSTGDILACLEFMRESRGHMMRLTNRPPPDERLRGQQLFGRIRPGAPYRASTQATIWHRATLMDLLRDGESIWQFEMNGSRRSDAQEDGFFCTWRQLAPYGYHVLERGKWFRHEAARLTRQGVPCDFSARPVMSRYEMLQWRLRVLKGRAQALLPWPQRERLRSAWRKLVPNTGGHDHV